MSAEGNKAIAGRWFTEFWGPRYNPDVIDELAAPDNQMICTSLSSRRTSKSNTQNRRSVSLAG